MNMIAVLLLIRVIIPLSILLGIGEWMRRCDARNWKRM